MMENLLSCNLSDKLKTIFYLIPMCYNTALCEIE